MATLREQIVAKARTQLGVRYWSMHAGPKGSASEGWGCAMFCAWCLNQVLGTSFVGGTYNFWGEVIGASQYNQGGTGAFKQISADELQPADLVCYFATSEVGYSSYCKHIAMYVGDGKVIGAMGKGEPGDSDYLNIGIKETAIGGQSVGGTVRYIRCKMLTGESAKNVELFPVKAEFTTVTDNLAVRDAPTTSGSTVVTRYPKGSKVNVDGIALADGRAWGHYIGENSGESRYISLGTLNNVSF